MLWWLDASAGFLIKIDDALTLIGAVPISNGAVAIWKLAAKMSEVVESDDLGAKSHISKNWEATDLYVAFEYGQSPILSFLLVSVHLFYIESINRGFGMEFEMGAKTLPDE